MTEMFSDEEKLEIVRKEIEATDKRAVLESLTTTDVGCAIAISDKGGKYFVQFYTPHYDMIAVRAVHRIKRKRSPFTYLFNGQGGKNLEPFLFNGEEGTLTQATTKQIRDYWRAVAPHLDKAEFELFYARMTGRFLNQNSKVA